MATILAATSDVPVAWITVAGSVFAALLTFLGVFMTLRTRQQGVKVESVDSAVGSLVERLVEVERRADRYEQRADEYERRAEECEEREANHLRDHHGHVG